MSSQYIVSTGEADVAYISSGGSSVNTSSSLTSFKRVRNALINVTKKLVGDSLSTVNQNGVLVPSVLKDITGGNIPEYPFVVISNGSSSGIQSSKIVHQGLDENGKLVIVNDNYLTFDLKAYGEYATSILSDLKIKMNFGYDRWQFQEEAEASFNEFSDITYQPVYLSERFLPASQMSVTVSVRTYYKPSGFYDVKGVDVEGDLYIGTDEEVINVPINVNNNE